MILRKVSRDTLQSNTQYLPKYHVILFKAIFYLNKHSLGKFPNDDTCRD